MHETTKGARDDVELVGPHYSSRSFAYLAGTARFEPPKPAITARPTGCRRGIMNDLVLKYVSYVSLGGDRPNKVL